MSERRGRFEAQVLPHIDAAYRYARWLSRAPGDADDVVQDAMLRAWRGFDALRGADARAWLLTIVRNCHWTALRQRQRRGHVPLPEEHDPQDGHVMVATDDDPEAALLKSGDVRTLEALVAALPDIYREVLVLREMEELDYREIALVVGVPVGTVMSRLSRARAALRSHWLIKDKGVADAAP